MDALERGIEAIREGNRDLGCQLLADWLKGHPDHCEAHDLLGCTLAAMLRTREAITAFRAGVSADADYAPLRYNLGTLLLTMGQFENAVVELRAAVQRDPTKAAAWSNLCAAQRALGHLSEAEVAGRRATRLNPGFVEGWINLGNTLKDRLQLDQALAAYAKAAALDFESTTSASNALLTQCYLQSKPSALAAAHREFGSKLANRVSERPLLEHANNERIRIGYVSGDFRLHSIMYFFGALLNAHDRSRFDIYLYSDVESPDAETARIARATAQWSDVRGLTDEELWAKIRADNIDVLVDLAGHTGKRLAVYARRAAPTQVTWLGYPFSTGLATMDYRITDAIADPPDADEWYTEHLIRLEGPFLCYLPPAGSPAVAPAPVQRNGYVTFGSFNHLAKLGDDAVVLYSAILEACEGAKLLLKCKSLSDSNTARALVDKFMQYGISPQRLILKGHVADPVAHLAAYADVDIALDPSPYNGTTTTFEALWMGVPVLTLSGHWHASRVGASVMSHLGLSTLVASNPDALLVLARELSSQHETLVELRQVLRQLLLKSPLCDRVGFARNFENALLAAMQERSLQTRTAAPAEAALPVV